MTGSDMYRSVCCCVHRYVQLFLPRNAKKCQLSAGGTKTWQSHSTFFTRFVSVFVQFQFCSFLVHFPFCSFILHLLIRYYFCDTCSFSIPSFSRSFNKALFLLKPYNCTKHLWNSKNCYDYSTAAASCFNPQKICTSHISHMLIKR